MKTFAIELPPYKALKKGRSCESLTLSYQDEGIEICFGSMSSSENCYQVATAKVRLGDNLSLEIYGATDFYLDLYQILQETKTGSWFNSDSRISAQLIECAADFVEPHLRLHHLKEIAECVYQQGRFEGKNEIRKDIKKLLALEYTWNR